LGRGSASCRTRDLFVKEFQVFDLKTGRVFNIFYVRGEQKMLKEEQGKKQGKT